MLVPSGRKRGVEYVLYQILIFQFDCGIVQIVFVFNRNQIDTASSGNNLYRYNSRGVLQIQYKVGYKTTTTHKYARLTDFLSQLLRV